MIVCKFGGSSVANIETAKNIKNIIRLNKNRRIIVVSALGKSKKYNYKITDKLFDLYFALKEGREFLSIIETIFNRYEEFSKELNLEINWKKHKQAFIKTILKGDYSKPYIVSRGEYYSALLYSRYLNIKFLDAKEYIYFRKDGTINDKKTQIALAKLDMTKRYIIGGYYGSDDNSNICVFDRGGSDITGAIICKLLNFETYENYTDVDGVYTRNPNIFKNAISLPVLSYDTAIKMAECGNEVVHRDAIKIMKNSNSTLLVKSTINFENMGTLITLGFKDSSQHLYISVCGVNIATFTKLNKKDIDIIYSSAELLKIVKDGKYFYVLAKNIYSDIGAISDSFVKADKGFLISFFCEDKIMNKRNIKSIIKISKKIKKYGLFFNFFSYFNNFGIICLEHNYNQVIEKINAKV